MSVRIYTLIFSSVLSVLLAQLANAESFNFCYERWKPFAYVDENGRFAGESIELIRKSVAQANITVNFKELPFARCIAAVSAGQFDFILHSDKNESLPFIDIPINNWQITLAFHRDSQIKNLKIPQNTKVMLSWDYQYPAEVMGYLSDQHARLVKTKYYAKDDESTRLLFQHLIINRVDAMLVDRVWAEYKIALLGLPLRTSNEDLYVEPQFVAYSPKEVAKAKRLEHLLREMLKQR